MIFELPDIFFGSHPKKEMASQPLQVRQYGFAKNSKKPYHKRIFKKSGDIFFGATSHQNSRFLVENGCFFGPMAKFRRYGRICVVICLRISYNHAMGREAGRATGGRLLSGTDQRHRFPVRISGRRYAGGGHAAVRLAAPVGAGVCLYLRGNGRAFVGR